MVLEINTHQYRHGEMKNTLHKAGISTVTNIALQRKENEKRKKREKKKEVITTEGIHI